MNDDKEQSTFMGWASYPLRNFCEHCGETYHPDYDYEHEYCEEEKDDEEDE